VVFQPGQQLLAHRFEGVGFGSHLLVAMVAVMVVVGFVDKRTHKDTGKEKCIGSNRRIIFFS